MKISLFFKPYTTKAGLFFIVLFIIVSIPIQVKAGFFNSLFTNTGKIEASSDQSLDGFQDESSDIGTDDFFFNSQTIPLLEASLNPDMKTNSLESDITIVEGEALVSSGALLGNGLEAISTGNIIIYTVKEGDTLSEIAETYDISLNTIRWENNFTGSNIKVGQELRILPVTGVKHIVKKGDTLDKIANKYDAELDDVLIFNGLSTQDILKEGDILIIPNGVPPTSVPQKTSYTTSSSASPTASSSKVTPGYYIRPAQGPITSSYGSRRGGYHYGVDIGNKRGTTVVAAASGVVTKVVNYCVEGKSSCGGRYGNYIEIEHPNGQTTVYAHLSKVSVSVGQKVSQGKKIGTIGNTGRSTGPHLHFEIQKSNGSTIRPPF